MRDYGIVSPQFWVGESGKKFRGHRDQQIVALYLITSPHANMTGVYHLPRLYIAHDTGLPLKGASKALQSLIEAGFCEYDEPKETVFVIRMAAIQLAEELQPLDKRVPWLKKEVEKMTSAALKQRFLQTYGQAFHLMPENWQGGPIDEASEPHRSQDQGQDINQDQDQDQERERDQRPDRPRNGSSHVHVQDEVERKRQWIIVRADFPEVGGRVDWIGAEKFASKLVSDGVATWEELYAAVMRYKLYIQASGAYAMNPVKFFHADDKPWSMPWTILEERARPGKPAARVAKSTAELEALEAKEATDREKIAKARADFPGDSPEEIWKRTDLSAGRVRELEQLP
jgi:hypothetical protein